MSREITGVCLCLLAIQLFFVPKQEVIITEKEQGMNWQATITRMEKKNHDFDAIPFYKSLEKANQYLLDNKITVESDKISLDLHRRMF